MAASVPAGSGGREVREHRGAEYVGVGDDRGAGGFGEQLGADSLAGGMGSGVA
jgi:hypothetical protein